MDILISAPWHFIVILADLVEFPFGILPHCSLIKGRAFYLLVIR